MTQNADIRAQTRAIEEKPEQKQNQKNDTLFEPHLVAAQYLDPKVLQSGFGLKFLFWSGEVFI